MAQRVCPEFSYYDTAVSECTPCDHLCDHHEYQGTTAQCMDKCNKYYQRMTQTLSTHSTTISTLRYQSTVTSRPNHQIRTPLDGDTGNAILAVVVLILVLAVATSIGYLIWKKRSRWCCQRCVSEEVKTSVPCSEEDGLGNVGDSKKPLMGSSGPIRQAESCPEKQPEESLPCQSQYPMTFAGFAGVRYAVLDAPLTSEYSHSTVPKEAYCTNSTSNSESQTTIPKGTYSEGFSELVTSIDTPDIRPPKYSFKDQEKDGSRS